MNTVVRAAAETAAAGTARVHVVTHTSRGRQEGVWAGYVDFTARTARVAVVAGEDIFRELVVIGDEHYVGTENDEGNSRWVRSPRPAVPFDPLRALEFLSRCESGRLENRTDRSGMVTLSATAVWDERRRRVWPRLGLVHGDLDIDPQGRVVRIAWRGRKGGVEFRFTDLGADVEQIRAPENALSAAGVLRSTLFGRE